MLERIATYLRKELETRGKVRAAMAYPMVMMVLATGVTIFLLTYILPKFAPVVQANGSKLPRPTLVMMAVSDGSDGLLVLWLAGAVAWWPAFIYARRTPAGRQFIDWLKINARSSGPMLRKVTISRSIRTLGTMLASGVGILDSIKLAGQVRATLLRANVGEGAAGGDLRQADLRSPPRQSARFPACWCR